MVQPHSIIDNPGADSTINNIGGDILQPVSAVLIQAIINSLTINNIGGNLGLPISATLIQAVADFSYFGTGDDGDVVIAGNTTLPAGSNIKNYRKSVV